MAEEETAPDEGTEKKKKGLPSFVMPLVLALVGLGGGGFLGAKVVGPKLTADLMANLTPAELAAHTPKKKAASDDEEGDGEHAEGEEVAEGDEEHAEKPAEGGGEHGPPGPPPVYSISDLVLNPAGSGGTRFLMLSVAFDMKDSTGVDLLKQRDAEIKDAVLALVGAKTVEQLAEVSAREPLKVEIKDLVAKIVKKKKIIKRVSFPQFVIQ
jgi:flagellar protein FliL